jgi:hypothetical protein
MLLATFWLVQNAPVSKVTGTRIGVYDITTQIGAGGMGEPVN